MNESRLTLAAMVQLADRFFLLFLLAGYALAAVFPDLGLRIGEPTLGELALFGDRVRLSPSMLLLAVLLWGAGLSVPTRRLGGLLRRPGPLLIGLAANLLVPLAFILGVSGMMRLWHGGDEMQGVLVGLGLIAAMPIAGSAAAWSRKADGDEALTLGLIVSSTFLSPLTTPVVLYAVSLMAGGPAAADFRALSGRGTGVFLTLCVLAPSLLGMLTLRVVGEGRVATARPGLKLLNAVALLLLVYASASATLPVALSRFAPDFFGSMLAVAVGLCVVCFAAGWLVARLLRAGPPQQAALLFGLGMNNNGTGMVLASSALAGRPEVLLLVVCYNLVQHLVAGGVDLLRRRDAEPALAEGRLSWGLALRPVLSFGFLLAAGVVVANASAAYWNLRTVAATHRWVAHTHEVMTQIEETLSLLKDAETGQRGYLITGDRRYLEPYEAAVRRVHGRFERLREMTADNAAQKARTEELRGMIDDRLAELDETIRLRRDKGFDAAREVVLADRGKRRMDEIRRLMGKMEAEEQALLERRAGEFDARVARSLGLVIVVACIVLVSFFVRGLIAEPVRGGPPRPSPSRIPQARGQASRVSGNGQAQGPEVRGRFAAALNRVGLHGSYFLGMAGIGFTLPFLPLYLEQDGMSDRAIGLVSTLAALAGLVQYPVGKWSDRLGRRKPFLVGALAVLAAATFLMHGAHGTVWLGLLVVLFAENGACRATVESLAGAEAARLAQPGRVGEALGALRFWRPAAIMLAALSSGVIAKSYGVGAVLLPLAAVQTLAVLACLLIRGDGERRPVQDIAACPPPEGMPAKSRPRDGVLWVFVAAMVLFHVSNAPGGVYLGLFLKRDLQAPDWALSTAFVVSMVAWMAAIRLAGGLADRLGRRPLLIAAWSVMASRLALVALATAPWQVLAVQVLDGAAQALFAVAAAAWVTDRVADPRRAGEAQALVGAALVFGSAIGPALSGLVVDALGYRGTFLLLAGIGTAATAVVVAFVPETAPARAAVNASEACRLPTTLSSS
jgi:CHASE3 domain sensor protein/predicted Na+-dependent transporter/predicted MFS family arabinose efflux permease